MSDCSAINNMYMQRTDNTTSDVNDASMHEMSYRVHIAGLLMEG